MPSLNTNWDDDIRAAPEGLMERISAIACAFVLAAAVFSAPPGVAEPASGGQSKAPVPSYIEADPSAAEQTLGRTVTGEVFSDRYTPLRERLVAASLRANPAAGARHSNARLPNSRVSASGIVSWCVVLPSLHTISA